MGYRDNNLIDDGSDDEMLRRLLDRSDDPLSTLPPPDLVSRTLSRLPAAPPSLAEQKLAQGRRQRNAIGACVLLLVLLIAALNIWGVAGGGPQMAFLIGDGRGGLSALLLGLQLAAKPFWNTLRAADTTVLLGGVLAAVVGFALLRLLVRRVQTREEYEVETL